MRFHCLGVPHTVTSAEYCPCAYTQKVLKFCKMMKARGHYIIHYGHEDSQVSCDEHVTVVKQCDLEKAYPGHDHKVSGYKFDVTDHVYKTFYSQATIAVSERKQPNDFILAFWGAGVRPVCDAHSDLIVVEPGIGYPSGFFARYKIFESYAILHAYCGIQGVSGKKQPSWYDVVIPNYFDTEDFEFHDAREDPDPYYLYIGRVIDCKGVNIAIQVTKHIGAKLIVAGQYSLKSMGYSQVPDHVQEVGYADKPRRKELMSKALCAFVPSLYLEPFGGVQIELLMSGTPTITSDWGAFVENNIHGVTGYRCRTFEQFCWAARNIKNIDPTDCFKWSQNFTLECVSKMYEEYFKSVLDVVIGDGWYHENPQRRDLDSLVKKI